MKKVLLLLTAVFFNIVLTSQDASQNVDQEKSDKNYRTVEGLENWTCDYDISSLKDGKYNLIIRSTDKAGNMSIDGPINIFVDSFSDLPVVSVSSPSKSMRLGGDFNVVGSAMDDDGISAVQVRLDEGSWMTAEGTLFWSLLVDTSAISDGVHTIHAKAVDTNGLEGNEVTVQVNLDKNKPLIFIESKSNGEILSGKQKISGTVKDANGIEYLEYSLDGETWENLKLSGRNDSAERGFSLDLDTRDSEGGTSYIRFRTKDGTGSEGATVFVYYSDNRKPQISITAPLENDVLNGRVTVTGTVTDEVGVSSFSCITDKNGEETIELIPGNPYWSKTFDFTGEKNGLVTFRALDLSGNTAEYKLKLKLDPAGDLPVVALPGYSDGTYLDINEPVLKGIVTDDDGVLSVSWSIDGGETEKTDTDGAFVIDLVSLSQGKHVIQITGTDYYGISGNPFKFTFLKAPERPVISADEFTRDKEVLPWVNGAVFQQGKTGKISGRVDGGEETARLFFSFNGEAEVPVKLNKGLFITSLPTGREPGGYNFTLRAVDSLEREAYLEGRVSLAPAPGKDETFQPVQQDSPGLYINDRRTGGDLSLITEAEPLTGFLSGDTIRSIDFNPPVSFFRAEIDGNAFSLVPSSEGGPEKFVLKVTGDSGREYVSSEIYGGSDISAPVVTTPSIRVPVKVDKINTIEKLTKDEKGKDVLVRENETVTELSEVESSFVRSSLIFSCGITDRSDVKSVQLKFCGPSASYDSPLILEPRQNEDGTWSIDREIDISHLEEGDHFLDLIVTDALGNIASKSFPLKVDRTAPEIQIIAPGPDEPVEGIITVSGRIDNFNGGGDVLFSEDGAVFTPVEMTGHNTFSRNIDLSAEGSDPEHFLFKAVDKGRNAAELKPRFNVDLEADRPVAVIEIPAEGATLRNDFDVTGLVFDDDEVASIYYSLDGGEFTRIDGNFYYNIPFRLDELEEKKHVLSLYAEDLGGFPSETVSSDFVISKSEPVSVMLNPTIEEYNKSTVLLQGESFDENGIDEVFVSYDNGITYNKAIIEKELPAVSAVDGEVPPEETVTKTVKWTYIFDTMLPGDGTHSLLIKAIDGAGTTGISSTIINIDNTDPEIKLDSPGESGIVAGNLILDGKVFDGTRIKSVVSELQALEAKDFETVITPIETDGVFREVYDLSSYPPGLYNLNITVTDYAANSISETRNFELISRRDNESVNIYFPEEGREFAGPFAVDGKVSGREKGKVVLKIDGDVYDSLDPDENGLFSFRMEEMKLSEGNHVLQVVSGSGDSEIASHERRILYRAEGPWVSAGNMISGQFVSDRPMVTGTAGYSRIDAENKDKSKSVEYVEVSLDNGRTFTKAKGREEWEFRLETYDLPEGINQLLIKAQFRNGEMAITKIFVNIDETAPAVELITPEENRTFNGSVKIVGTAADENGIDSVEVLIREGSKARYEVPSFIQGLYLDFHALGSTYGEMGLGLSFFDDVVKLQVQAGMAPPGRFTGIVLGAKLLATIVDVPFSYFFGYDWDFFSMSLAVGANFNYFSMSPDGYYFTKDGVVLGSVLLQYEFAKFEIASMKAFNSYSFYVEGALWFISSDVQAGVTPTVSLGARIGIF